MDKISCNVCMDLLPLVKDGIASEDSSNLVKEHLLVCEHCSNAFGREIETETYIDDAVILGKIKKQMMLFLMTIMFLGTFFGMAISNGMSMFYNAIIMPAIGVVGYILLKKKSYFIPLVLFLFSFVWVAIRETIGGFLTYSSIIDLILMSAWWSIIFAGFSAIGVLIAWLLHYAFKKEV